MRRLKKIALVAVAIAATAGPAAAGPVSATAVAKLTVEVCGPLTATTGVPGLACFAAGAVGSVAALFGPWF